MKSKKSKPKMVSIVIPHYNTYVYLDQALRALKENTIYSNYEIIISDDASSDPANKIFLDSIKDKYIVLFHDKHGEFSSVCNEGERVSKGEYICFYNNDLICKKGWLTEMVKLLESNKKIGIVGPKLIFPDGTIQHAGVAFHFDKSSGHFWWHRKPANYPPANEVREYQAVTGGCLLIRKKLFNKVGKFDEEYFTVYEDSDLCLKVREAGYKIMYCPTAELIHEEAATQRLKDPGWRAQVNDRCFRYFIKKWGDKIVPDYMKYEPSVAKQKCPKEYAEWEAKQKEKK